MTSTDRAVSQLSFFDVVVSVAVVDPFVVLDVELELHGNQLGSARVYNIGFDLQ